MSQVGSQQEMSPQDSTFMFINALQEQLAKSDFVGGINKSRDSPASTSSSSTQKNPARLPASASSPTSTARLPASASSSSSTARHSAIAKWTDPDGPGARITRLKPPKPAK